MGRDPEPVQVNIKRCVLQSVLQLVTWSEFIQEVAMIYTVESEKDLEAVCAALQEAIVQRKFGVMAVHDLKETMAKKGVAFDRACRIFEVCNPHQARRVLEKRMEISTALPCRISVFPEGGRVKLATIRPTKLLNLFGDKELEAVAEEVEQVMVESMNEAAQG